MIARLRIPVGRLRCRLGDHSYGPRYEIPLDLPAGIQATPLHAWTCTRPGCTHTRAYLEEATIAPPGP